MFIIFLSSESRDYGSGDKIINEFSFSDNNDNNDNRRAGELNEAIILKSGLLYIDFRF